MVVEMMGEGRRVVMPCFGGRSRICAIYPPTCQVCRDPRMAKDR